MLALNRMKKKLWWLLLTIRTPVTLVLSEDRLVLWADMSLSVHVVIHKNKFRLSYFYSWLQKTIRQKHSNFPLVTSLLMYLIFAMYW